MFGWFVLEYIPAVALKSVVGRWGWSSSGLTLSLSVYYGRSDTFETRFPFRPITNYFRSRRRRRRRRRRLLRRTVRSPSPVH